MSTFKEQISSVDERQAKLAIEKSLLLNKALRSDDVDSIFKAQQYLQKITGQVPQGQNQSGTYKSIVFDPFEIASSQGFYNKNMAQVSYDLLRAMSKTPIVSAVVNTRKDQVTEYCAPQPDRYSKGFVLKKVGMHKNEELTDNEKREIDKLTQFLLDCSDQEARWDLWDFDSFIRMLVEDSLVLDQACAEFVQNRGGELIQFLPVDGATMRIADSFDNTNNIKNNDRKINGYYPSYVQLYQNRIINEYYPWELLFGVRNPTTNITSNGYGRSELEVLITTVTSMLNADAYNGKFFRNGTAPKGALLVKSAAGLNKDKISELRKEWTSMMSGVENMHKTPILDADKVEWMDLQKTNRDMEFSKFYEFLIKVICAVYKISPEEIGFPLEGSQSSQWGNSGKEEEKKYSMDKGLKPLLKVIASWINKFIIGPKSNGKYIFQFAGMNVEDIQAEENRLTKAVTSYMEINEVRKLRDLDTLPYGDMILNPIVQQKMQADEMREQGQNPFTQPSSQQEEGDDKDSPFTKSLQDFWNKEMNN